MDSILGSILTIILLLMRIYSYILLIYIFMSWFNIRDTEIGRLFARISEPYLEPFRRIIPPIGMIDISPIVAFFVLDLARAGIAQVFSWLM
ncbi:membrane protein [Weizmannia acidilactici]|jgi:YggT family protein|uniref:Membrane protein n=1 Tax=Weizmannia acidilactici TaxID=2607726 RepID=A0A5J4JFN2_9BACI|nr:YggT family protein [Weizmannia acidilactici]GER65537.1 membrane protein [Weizmannia acidilactici]GER70451.1 membrane protein [Weizmannia acidilactici]GER74077.1 membrane protein [Weizmannia acidilactici]